MVSNNEELEKMIKEMQRAYLNLSDVVTDTKAVQRKQNLVQSSLVRTQKRIEMVQEELMKMVDWKKVERDPIPPTHKFEKEGEAVEGVLQKIKPEVGINKSTAYHIKKEDGGVITVWGNVILDDLIKPEMLNKPIKITYLGLEDNEDKTRKYKNYEVFTE